jgi:hypothetical protein
MKAVLAIVGLLAGLSSQLPATTLPPLAPGATVVFGPGDSVSPVPNSGFVENNITSYSIPAAGGKVTTGKDKEAVFFDPVNPSDLDFYFMVTECPNNGSSFCQSYNPVTKKLTNSGPSVSLNITSVNITTYTGIDILGVGYLTAPTPNPSGGATIPGFGSTFFGAANSGSLFFSPTQAAPVSVTRSADGSELTYNIGSAGSLVKAGEASAVLEVQTSSTGLLFGNGKINVNAVAAALGVTVDSPAPTPEPGFYGLMAFGVVALLFSARRYSRKRAAHTA